MTLMKLRELNSDFRINHHSSFENMWFGDLYITYKYERLSILWIPFFVQKYIYL